MQQIDVADERLRWYAPQPVVVRKGALRLERFPRTAYDHLQGRIGPLANLRSSSGCRLAFMTDSPWVVLQLDRLRHHQPVPVGIDCEVSLRDGSRIALHSADLREQSGKVDVRFATGLERGGPRQEVVLHLPLISTAVVSGIKLTREAVLEPAPACEPRWLAIGDSLTQGFCVQQPLQHWLPRLERELDLPAWNLGVGGLTIEPEVFAPALASRRWDLVTVGLGSNHAWDDGMAATFLPAAEGLVDLLEAGGHGRIVWLLPPWKPCEDGKGPAEFMGVPLDARAAARMAGIREHLTDLLADHPQITLTGELMPRDHRLYADGLHPAALGFSALATALAPVLTAD